MDPLPPLPATLTAAGGGLLEVLGAGRTTTDPAAIGQRTGRLRRWRYAAGGNADVVVGAAIVALPGVAVCFAFAAWDGRLVRFDRRLLASSGASVSTVPGASTAVTHDDALIVLGGDGSIDLDVPIEDGGRLRARLSAGHAVPATCSTPTPAGGWNVTEKIAGYPLSGEVEVAGERRRIDGAGWTDWTTGRQDRHTNWRWLAGAGPADGDRLVGVNASSGMNGAGPGENVIWWEGVPYHLPLLTIEPEDHPSGAWRFSGPSWQVRLEPAGCRSADENLLLLRSRYVQPVGILEGTLPGAGGGSVDIMDLPAVAEDHEARW